MFLRPRAARALFHSRFPVSCAHFAAEGESYPKLTLSVVFTCVSLRILQISSSVREKYLRVRHTNERSNLNFVELLRLLDVVGKATSKDLASGLAAGRSVKEISNDLRRLRKMGLVKVERRKRLCKSRWLIRGNFYRGFEYIYYLSKFTISQSRVRVI
jgi:hypothetical protein